MKVYPTSFQRHYDALEDAHAIVLHNVDMTHILGEEITRELLFTQGDYTAIPTHVYYPFIRISQNGSFEETIEGFNQSVGNILSFLFRNMQYESWINSTFTFLLLENQTHGLQDSLQRMVSRTLRECMMPSFFENTTCFTIVSYQNYDWSSYIPYNEGGREWLRPGLENIARVCTLSFDVLCLRALRNNLSTCSFQHRYGSRDMLERMYNSKLGYCLIDAEVSLGEWELYFDYVEQDHVNFDGSYYLPS